MVHFRSKNDIVQWLEKHCPRKAIVRSLSQNGCELLGGFNPIPSTTQPGWIVRVASVYNKRMWIVAIIPCKGKPDFEIRILSKVPWGKWIALFISEEILNESMLGDKPRLYRRLAERTNESV